MMHLTLALVASAPIEARAALFLAGVVCVGMALFRVSRRRHD